MVRTKISQSSAQRQKRGHTAVNQRPDSTETQAPVGLNNNGPYSQTEKNGLIHANGTTGEPEGILDKLEELKIINTDNNKEDDSLSADSLSEISKFESEFTFSIIESRKKNLPRYHLSLNKVISYKDYFIFLCVLSSSQPRPELPARWTSWGLCFCSWEPKPLLDSDPGGSLPAAGQAHRGDEPLLQQCQPHCKDDSCGLYFCVVP